MIEHRVKQEHGVVKPKPLVEVCQAFDSRIPNKPIDSRLTIETGIEGNAWSDAAVRNVENREYCDREREPMPCSVGQHSAIRCFEFQIPGTAATDTNDQGSALILNRKCQH